MISVDFLNEELLSRIFSFKEKAEAFKLLKDIFSKPRGYATIIFSYLPEANNLRVEQFSTQLNRREDRKQQLEGTTSTIMENGIFYRVLRGKETVYDVTYSILKEIFPEIYNDTHSLALGYSIVVPLTSQSKVIGALLVSSFGLDHSSVPEVQILGNSISAILNIVDHHLSHEVKYRQLVESAQEGIWAIDSEARTTFVNPRMADMLGYTVEEMNGQSLYEFMDERGKVLAGRLFERRREGVRESHEFEFMRKDGARVYTSLETSPLRDDRGGFTGALAFVTNITEKKKMNEELYQNEVKYRQLVENAHEGIWATDSKMKTTFVNRRMAEMLGYTVEEMFGRSVYEFMDKKNIAISKNKLEQRKKGVSESYELEFIRKDGKRIYTIITISPILDEKGIFAGVLAFVTDLSDKRRMEEEIRSLEKFPAENPSPILRLSQDGVILASNRSSGSLLESWGCKVGGYAPKN
ncbi:MAG: PAS domain-containing protein, partial [Nitrososphaeria archaeon]